jgi:peptidoglycan/xylan/chitin deacetylase (PgdA/CDA1 family)
MMSSESYPRDLIGYGRRSPHPHWPGNARLAVQFVINYEEGGENCILHGDAASESFLSESVGTPPLVGVRNMNMESMYEYGSRAGFWRLHRLFTQRGLPLTVYGVAMAMARNPEAVAAMPATATAGLTIRILGLRPSGSTSVRRWRSIPRWRDLGP